MFIEGIDRQNLPSYFYSYVSWLPQSYGAISLLIGSNLKGDVEDTVIYCTCLVIPGSGFPSFCLEPQTVAISHCAEEFYMLYPNPLALVVQVARSQLFYISLLFIFFIIFFLCLWSSPMAFSDDHFLVINPKRDSVQIKFFIKKDLGSFLLFCLYLVFLYF